MKKQVCLHYWNYGTARDLFDFIATGSESYTAGTTALCEVVHYFLPLFCHFHIYPQLLHSWHIPQHTPSIVNLSARIQLNEPPHLILHHNISRPAKLSHHSLTMCSEKRINMVHTCGHHRISSTHPPYIAVCHFAVAQTPTPVLAVIPCYPHMVSITTVQVATACGADECRKRLVDAKLQREGERRRVE